MMKQLYVFLCAFSAAFAISCSPVRGYAPGITDSELQAEQIAQNQLVSKMKSQERFAYQTRLIRVGSKIALGGSELCGSLTELQKMCDFDFKLEETGELNAYADGKNIIITHGMMDFLSSDEELAAVLAHEWAHNMMGHVESKGANATIGAIFGAILDVALETGGSSFTRMGANIGAGAYSQSKEVEADYIGIYIVARSGYEFADVPNIWRKMSVKFPNAVYVSTTHPNNAERFVRLKKTVAEIRQKKAAKLPLVPQLISDAQEL